MISKTMQPLAISLHAPNACGAVHCFSFHQKAINLLTADGHMLTLQPYGYGLSPMGWLFRRRDFAILSDALRRSKKVEMTAKGLKIDFLAANGVSTHRLTILCHARRLGLYTPCLNIPEISRVSASIGTLKAETGLFGDIQSAIALPLAPPLQTLINQFLKALAGEPAQWQTLIGLGPGLTPSCDDTIVGMLAVFFADPRTSVYLDRINPPLFSDLAYLQTLTTTVSAHYLYHAGQGHFSSTLLSVVSKLQSTKNKNNYLDRLLTHGHTSGSDSLLGIWLGVLVINRYFSNRQTCVC